MMALGVPSYRAIERKIAVPTKFSLCRAARCPSDDEAAKEITSVDSPLKNRISPTRADRLFPKVGLVDINSIER
jgi:hypothetical protein